MSASRWKDLAPDARMLEALFKAGPRPENGVTEKRQWGVRFADACAMMFADEMRQHRRFKSLEVRPNADGSGRESLTGVGGYKQKKVDVIASTLASGLQVAISLKAENFASEEETYGKNLTNRLYELQDEVRAIHEYQPRARVVGVFFLPLASTSDRLKTSSFARAVASLRARTGRIDFSLPTQFGRLDSSIVGLYVPDSFGNGPKAGVVRYFDVTETPPRRGRPKLETTMSLSEIVGRIAAQLGEDSGELIEYAEPEDDEGPGSLSS